MTQTFLTPFREQRKDLAFHRHMSLSAYTVSYSIRPYFLLSGKDVEGAS